MHKLTNDRMKWGMWALLVALALGGGLLRQARLVSDARSWMPVDIPLPPAGQGICREFETNLRAVYEVQVELRPSPVVFRSDLTGPQINRLAQELDRLLPEIDWSLVRNDKTVARNQSTFWVGDRTLKIVSGEFEAAPTQRYTIRARVRRSVPRLRLFHPHLQIRAAIQRPRLESREQRFRFLGICLMLPVIPLLAVIGYQSVCKRRLVC